ncbi:MAG: hypothetical protein ACRD9R_05650 [Pyrinomonadaceae bacterium]
MEHKLTITLPDEVYQPLIKAARELGQTPEELVARQVSQSKLGSQRNLSDDAAQAARARFERHFGASASGDPHFADNDRIDADLAREYGRGLDGDEE